MSQPLGKPVPGEVLPLNSISLIREVINRQTLEQFTTPFGHSFTVKVGRRGCSILGGFGFSYDTLDRVLRARI